MYGSHTPAPRNTTMSQSAAASAHRCTMLCLGQSLRCLSLTVGAAGRGVVSAPTRVVAISARGWWAGALRHMMPVQLSSSARLRAVERLQLNDTVADIRWPSSSGRRLKRIANLLDVHREPDAEVLVIVVDPCSRSRDLAEAAIETDAPTIALWLA